MAEGSCGAIQGANNAKITKSMTNTTPVAASGLCRAARRNEMAAVDKLKVNILPQYSARNYFVRLGEDCDFRLAASIPFPPG